MKRTMTTIALLTGLIGQYSFANLVEVGPIANWTGTWKDSNGGLMVMVNSVSKAVSITGAIDVSAIDSGSIYRLVCTPQGQYSGAVQCTGDGVNYEQADKPQRFTYRSQLIYQKDGSIGEEWECVFEFNAEKRNGKSLFRRVNEKGSSLTR